jgi:hypothetical protein
MPRSDKVVSVRWSTFFDVVVVVVVFAGSEVQPPKLTRLAKAKHTAINFLIPRGLTGSRLQSKQQDIYQALFVTM